jgi:hypothetical protein
MKREALGTARVRTASPRARGGRARAIPARTPLARGELISLLRRLRGEVEAFLNDLGVRHESSRNHESSRLARRAAWPEK